MGQIAKSLAFPSISLCLGMLLVACSAQPEPQGTRASAPTLPPPAAVAIPKSSPKPSKTVTTSFQGKETAGQTTASGEPYNPKDLTAASRTLPMGSTVKVTNPQNGQSVNVRINDRGPFVKGRSLDLSNSAAKKIGITEKGVTRVKLTPVSSHSTATQAESSREATPPLEAQ